VSRSPGSDAHWFGRKTRVGTLARVTACLVACATVIAGAALPFVGGIGLAVKTASTDFLSASCDISAAPTPQSTRILASDGKTLIASLFTQNRQDIPLTQVPATLQRALIDTEEYSCA
jgi:membrane peptidoglycan carboxypeptidase